MQHIKLLFKRDAIEGFSSFKKKKDLLGILSSFFLIMVIYGVFIYVFSHFVKMYIETDFGNSLARINRISELFTVCLGAVFVVNVIVGIKKIYTVLANSKDNDILIYQPISTGSIFVYKLLKVYISQILSTLFIIAPVMISIDLISPLVGGIGYYFSVIAILLLMPMISCAIAGLFAVPYMAVARRISSKFIVLLIIYVAVIGVVFFFYGNFLRVLSELVRSGNIKYVFDLKTINRISAITNYLYPGKFFTNILLNNKVLINILVVILISSLAILLAYYIIKKVYIKTIQNQLEGNASVYHNNVKLKKHSPSYALLQKEFLVVLRTPTYAFQYFAMSITMPFMVFICVSLLESMLETLTIINCNYSLAIFVVSMLSILTNTFCTTNISRDGKMFAIMKTMPVTISQIIKSKVLFCSIVSFFSVFISSFVLLVSGFLNFVYFLVTFIVGFLFSLVQIAYATRKDMKNPSFPSNQEDITEGNSNMSTLILTGLLTTIVAGGGSVLLSIIISLKYNEILASYISIGFVLIITLISLTISFIYLFKGINEEYYVSDI